MKTVKFYTFGCKVNQYETQDIREQFVKAGFEERQDGELCDFYVINTCTVTHKADSDSLAAIRRVKRSNPEAGIIVTGCLAELDGPRIRKIDPSCTIVKNRDKERILEYISRRYGYLFAFSREGGGRGGRKNALAGAGISYFQSHTRAFLKIQDGCDNFCSYCKVPLVRGRPRSKPVNRIIQEAGRLAENGIKEIVLCGICLGSYGKDLSPAASLIEVIGGLEKIEGLLRIRLSSIEAADVSDELISRIAESGSLCRHLHIPLQSGDDAVLKMMNRRYAASDYLQLINKIKARVPLISITTDVLVGFPGETDENFQNTLRLINDVLPLKVHIFPYSRRAGTAAAAGFGHSIDRQTIKTRISYLKSVAENCSRSFKERFLNSEMSVLVESCCKGSADYWRGYTDNYIAVKLRSDRDIKNQLISLKLKKLSGDSVIAE